MGVLMGAGRGRRPGQFAEAICRKRGISTAANKHYPTRRGWGAILLAIKTIGNIHCWQSKIKMTEEFSQQFKLLGEDVLGLFSAFICIFYRAIYVPYLGFSTILRFLYQISCDVLKWIDVKRKEIFVGIDAGVVDGNKARDDIKGKTLLQSNACGPFLWIKENEINKINFFVELGKMTQADIFEPGSTMLDPFTVDIEGHENNELWRDIKTQMLQEAEEEPEGDEKDECGPDEIIARKVLFPLISLKFKLALLMY
jgi:hypothetical protein